MNPEDQKLIITLALAAASGIGAYFVTNSIHKYYLSKGTCSCICSCKFRKIIFLYPHLLIIFFRSILWKKESLKLHRNFFNRKSKNFLKNRLNKRQEVFSKT